MPAASTDLFKKAARRFATTLNTSIGDAVVDNFTLNSTVGLPTDTAISIVVDRVDGAGNHTPTLEEEIVGVVSGSNIITAVRGVSGTAQSHLAGAVVEVKLSADMWDDVVDGLLVEHNQDGTHNLTGYATLAGTETLTNKTLTSPVVNDATINKSTGNHGDIFFQDAAGDLIPLAPGTAGQQLQTNGVGADPTWVTDSTSTYDTCVLRKTTADSFTASTWNIVDFTGEDVDTNNMHDNTVNPSRITIQTAGVYIVTGVLSYSANASGLRASAIFLNGTSTPLAASDYRAASPLSSTVVCMTNILQLNAGDYIELAANPTVAGLITQPTTYPVSLSARQLS